MPESVVTKPKLNGASAADVAGSVAPALVVATITNETASTATPNGKRYFALTATLLGRPRAGARRSSLVLPAGRRRVDALVDQAVSPVDRRHLAGPPQLDDGRVDRVEERGVTRGLLDEEVRRGHSCLAEVARRHFGRRPEAVP